MELKSKYKCFLFSKKNCFSELNMVQRLLKIPNMLNVLFFNNGFDPLTQYHEAAYNPNTDMSIVMSISNQNVITFSHWLGEKIH